MTVVKIVDVYSGNQLDLNQLKADGFQGILFKYGQGTVVDVPEKCPQWLDQAHDMGFLVGGYWIPDSRVEYSRQIETIQKTFPDPTVLNQELGFYADVEKPVLSWTWPMYWNPSKYGLRNPYPGYHNVLSFLGRLIEMGVTPGIYTNPDCWKNLLSPGLAEYQAIWLAKLPLWTANWPFIHISGISKPSLYGKWTTWRFWQWRGEPDYNDYNGTLEQFYQQFQEGGAPVEPPAPPEPEPEPEPETDLPDTRRLFRVRHDTTSPRTGYKPRSVGLAGAPEVNPASVDTNPRHGTARTPMNQYGWEAYMRYLCGDKFTAAIGTNYAMFNTAGWPQMESLFFGGNIVEAAEVVENCIRLKLADWTAGPGPYKTWMQDAVACQKFTVIWQDGRVGLAPAQNLYYPNTCKYPVFMPLAWLEEFPPLPRVVKTTVRLNVRAEPGVLNTLPLRTLAISTAVQILEYRPMGEDVWARIAGGGWIALLYNKQRYTDWAMQTTPPLESWIL